jgi:hypothetical protein
LNIYLLNHRRKKNKTYRTWRAVIVVNDFGIEPERLLLLRRLPHKNNSLKV